MEYQHFERIGRRFYSLKESSICKEYSGQRDWLGTDYVNNYTVSIVTYWGLQYSIFHFVEDKPKVYEQDLWLVLDTTLGPLTQHKVGFRRLP